MRDYSGILPAAADLRPAVDFVFDQGNIGSCVANALARLIGVIYERATGFDPQFSRLYLNFWDRAIANALGTDGALPVNALIVAQTRGICLDATYPYVPANENTQPPANCDVEAAKYKITGYETCPDAGNMTTLLAWIKNCIANGSPVAYSFGVTQSFMDDAGACKNWHKTSWSNAPSSSNPLLGGHENFFIGWDDDSQRVLGENSWGPEWGDGGFYGFPYAWLSCLSTVYAVTSCQVPLVPIPYSFALSPQSTIHQVLEAIYQENFQRSAEPDGVAYWTNFYYTFMRAAIRYGAQGTDRDHMPPT